MSDRALSTAALHAKARHIHTDTCCHNSKTFFVHNIKVQLLMLALYLTEAESRCCVVKKMMIHDADLMAISIPSADGTLATSCHCHM